MKKFDLQKTLKQLDWPKTSSERFHKISSNKKLFVLKKNEIANWPKSWITIHFKTYPRLDQTPLIVEDINSKIKELILKRRSIRVYSLKNLISLKELSSLLYYAAGITHPDKDLNRSRRTYPSGGARYTLEIYPLVLNAKDIERGLYHYNVKDNTLELLEKGDFRKWFTKNIGGTYAPQKNPGIALLITTVLDRARIKYGERAYRLALLEAGHMAQNICLFSSEFNVGVCPVAGFVEKHFEKFLDINAQNEYMVHMLIMGKIRKGGEENNG